MFKKGDRVKRIKGNNHLKYNMILGDTYTVDSHKPGKLYIQEAPTDEGFEPTYFKLVKETDNYEIY